MRPVATLLFLAGVLLRPAASARGADFDGTYRASRLVFAGAGQNFAGSFDLDSDGREDIVLTLRSAEAAVLLATDTGFASPMKVPGTHPEPYHVASGLLDAGEIPDLVVVSRGGARVLLGNGDGTFREGVFLRSLFFGRIAIIGRVDADEHVDLLLADEIGGIVRVHLGDGQGGFVHVRDVTPEDEPHDLDAADLNGDQKLDLVAPHGVSDTVSVLLGKGDGTFQPVRVFPVGSNNRNVAIADIDVDGKLDVVVSNRVTSTASLLRGNGDGTLGTAEPIPTVQEPNAVEAADLTGDGIPDLLVAGGSSDGFLGLHLGIGSGSFRPMDVHRTGTAPLAVATGDWDLDGQIDALVANSESTFATLFRGAPGGGLIDRVALIPGGDPVAVLPARLTAGARTDLITASRNSTSVAVFLAAGAGLSEAKPFPLGIVPSAIGAGDFDADGLSDLAAADAVGTVILLLGMGDGTFEPSASTAAGILPTSAAVADLDENEKLDLAVSNRGSSDISFFAGDGEGRLAAPDSIPTGEGPIQVLAVDLDGDRKADLVTLNGGSKDISVILRRGGAFLPEVRVTAGTSPAFVAAADATGDGIPELFVADEAEDTVLVLEGKGDGSFEAAVPVPTGPSPSALALTDPDGNGFPELAVACPGADAVFVHPNDGTGGFGPPVAYAAGRAPRAIAAADLTGDGLEDLVTADSLGGTLSLIAAGAVATPGGSFRRGEATGDGALNISDPIAVLQFLFGSGATPRCLDAADATDDGAVNITDPIFLLNYLFLGAVAPPDPGPDACGPDPTDDLLADCTAACGV